MVTLTWDMAPSLAVLGAEHGADRIDRPLEPPRDLAVGVFQIARTRPDLVELGREPRAVGAEGLQLYFEGLPPPVALDAQVHRGLQGVDGRVQPALRALDRRFVVFLIHGLS